MEFLEERTRCLERSDPAFTTGAGEEGAFSDTSGTSLDSEAEN